MKITFEDKSYIELIQEDGKITIIIAAKDYINPLKKITNAVELTPQQFQELISSIQINSNL